MELAWKIKIYKFINKLYFDLLVENFRTIFLKTKKNKFCAHLQSSGYEFKSAWIKFLSYHSAQKKKKIGLSTGTRTRNQIIFRFEPMNL